VKQWQSTFNAIKDSVCIMDEQFRIKALNASTPEFFGKPASEILGRVCYEVMHGTTGPIEGCPLVRMQKTKQVEHLELASGNRHFEVSVHPFLDDSGGLAGGVHIISDITKRKQFEQELGLFKNLVLHSSDAIGMSTSDGRHFFQNMTFDRLFGDIENYSPQTVYADKAVAKQVFDTIMGGDEWQGEVEMVGRHRAALTILLRAFPIKDAHGKIIGLAGQHLDITERKRTEKRLVQVLAAVESAGDAIGISDERGYPIYQNHALSKLLGCQIPDELQPAGGIKSIVKDPAVAEEIMFNIQKGTPWEGELEIVKKDGSIFPALLKTNAIRDGAGKFIGLMCIISDITERKQTEAARRKLEDQLAQTKKLQAIGTLAGGVAHDFNNILNGVLHGLSLLELRLGGGDDAARDEIHDMKDLVMRGADLAGQLLGFARKGKYNPAVLNLARVVDESIDIFSRVRKDIVFRCEFDPEIQPVFMDRPQLEKSMLQLFIYAGTAMPKGGQILLRAWNEELGEKDAAFHNVKPGRFVRLVVSDTGQGTDKNAQEHLFEPFFTSEPSSGNRGIGLAAVYGIIKNHGGDIAVQSEPGKGTTFTLWIPLADVLGRKNASAGPVLKTSPASGTILVVDDEEIVLKLCARALKAMGYDVRTAGNGRDALDLVREHRGEISLVILDMTMPGMSGAQTFDALRHLAPEIRVLLTSGYTIEGQARELLEKGCHDFIQKPFSLSALSEKLKNLM
jgi:PAS domain S-box-containing protein